MLMVPNWIDSERFATVIEQVAATNAPRSPRRCAPGIAVRRAMCPDADVGSFDAQTKILARLHNEFIPNNGLKMVGKHHEIYLSDFRRVPPEKQRTILRQPATLVVTETN